MDIEHGEFTDNLGEEVFRDYENYERQKYQPLLKINERLEEIVRMKKAKISIPKLSNKLLDEFIENNVDELGRDIICDMLCKLEIQVEDKEKLFESLVEEERPLSDFERQFVSEVADGDRHLLDRYFPEYVFDEPSSTLFFAEQVDDEEAV